MAPNRIFPLLILPLIAAGVFLTGINWGLPSAKVNPYLFGARTPFTGQQVLALAGSTDDPNRGADVASHAFADRNTISIVNGTDQERARIVRRYRLMSYQPDEWNTLKALSEMKPGHANFDPKLYQYGGLWVYPVGALLKAASLFHLIDLRADLAWYLDHPDAFGRFYILLRCYSVLWGIVGVFTVYALVRRIVGGTLFPTIAGLCFSLMPVVVNMAHEAKPHLAGAVLMLLAVLAAARYVELGTRRAWLMAGALCGAAVGMVLSATPIFIVLPIMTLMRPESWRRRVEVCVSAAMVGGAVYAITNPYVPFHLLFHYQVLQSNLENSKAMYHPRLSIGGIRNAAWLIAAGTSPFLALLGAAGALALGTRSLVVSAALHSAKKAKQGKENENQIRDESTPEHEWPRIETKGYFHLYSRWLVFIHGAPLQSPAAERRRRATGLLLAAPALIVIGQCLLFATGKPGEFGRFMLLADIFLLIEAIVAIATFVPRRSVRLALGVLFIVTAAIPATAYVRAFWRDSQPMTPRLVLAERLRTQLKRADTLAVYTDPAPYCLPPVDLFRTEILLTPRGTNPSYVLGIQTVDLPWPGGWQEKSKALWTGTPISWADKPFEEFHGRAN